MNDPSVFVALLDDIILDLHGPAGIIFSENEIRGGSLKCTIPVISVAMRLKTSVCLTLVG